MSSFHHQHGATRALIDTVSPTRPAMVDPVPSGLIHRLGDAMKAALDGPRLDCPRDGRIYRTHICASENQEEPHLEAT